MIGFPENIANHYCVSFEALRLQRRNQGHHSPVNNLDADEVLNLISNTLKIVNCKKKPVVVVVVYLLTNMTN